MPSVPRPHAPRPLESTAGRATPGPTPPTLNVRTTGTPAPSPPTQPVDAYSPLQGAASLPSPTGHRGDATLSPLGLRLRTGTSVARFGGARLESQLDTETGSKARPSNKVDVLYDGVASFAERSRLIASAKSSIHLQTFIFTDDETGRALADQLIAKAKEGVEVRVIVDGLGSNRSGAAFFDRMRAASVTILSWETGLDLLQINNRWHEKHLIVDGRVAITGGMNIADEYALGGSGRLVFSRGAEAQSPWRDVDVRIEGPSVFDAQQAFMRNWKALGGPIPRHKLATYFPKPTITPDGVEVRVVQQHPTGPAKDEHIHTLYLHSIHAAKRSITIENAYFVPPSEIRDALIEAAQRGVQVRVLTNSKESSDMGFVSDAARYFYGELLDAGVKIYEQRGGTLHSKTASFDGQFSIIGSFNLNGRSSGLDTEAVVAIRDEATARSLDARFDAGIKSATTVSPADVARDSFVDSTRQWMISLLSWTI